jgi:dTDP-4-amino-4,6-dideoxygalactose transaminase
MSAPVKLQAPKIQVPFHRPSVGEEEVRAVAEVIRSGWLTTGAKTLEFERRFARYVGAEHAVAVSSCTAALHLSLEAIGLQPGDEVLLPTTTFAATAEVVTYFRARPVFVDILPQTLNISPRDAERKITPRTRAILLVHFAGQPCDMQELRQLAEAHHLPVIEDAAHALPAAYREKRVGGISELTAFSFYATKPLSTGEGGMITTGNEEYAARARRMRLHGIEPGDQEHPWEYTVRDAGYKYNFTDLHAALGIVQLAKCDAMYDARRRIAGQYSAAFAPMQALEIPATLADRQPSWHLYVLRLHLDQLRVDRRRFVEELADRGVGASVHFRPLHLQPAYQPYGYATSDFPDAEREYPRCVSLPIYPEMTGEEIEHVISAVGDVVKHWRR